VAVDPRTGEVGDSGLCRDRGCRRAINPEIVHGQAIGALVQGLGGVFLEELMYDEDAQILNASLADYMVPLASDFPNVRAITMELRRSKTNPLGAKARADGRGGGDGGERGRRRARAARRRAARAAAGRRRRSGSWRRKRADMRRHSGRRRRTMRKVMIALALLASAVGLQPAAARRPIRAG